MDRGSIYIYTGDGKGKSPAAWGRAMQAAAEGRSVVIIQFLKGKGLADSAFIRRMEPEIVTVEALKELQESRRETDVILTGSVLNDEIRVLADQFSRIETVKNEKAVLFH